MRIEEPFVKAHLALWLGSRGATRVRVSIDGAEPNPGTIQRVLTDAGYVRTPLKKSVAAWTGKYVCGNQEVLVVSRPGIDITAVLSDQRQFLAECKGEPTLKRTQAGNDRTALYTALGQLLMSAGKQNAREFMLVLGLPDTQRFREMAKEISNNRLLNRARVGVLLVKGQGEVDQV